MSGYPRFVRAGKGHDTVHVYGCRYSDKGLPWNWAEGRSTPAVAAIVARQRPACMQSLQAAGAAMKWLGYAWDAAAWFFLLSVASTGVIQLVRKCRARGRRKFRDEPLARVLALRPNASSDHYLDGA